MAEFSIDQKKLPPVKDGNNPLVRLISLREHAFSVGVCVAG